MKQLLYSIFLQIHQMVLAKQMAHNPIYNNSSQYSMYYPQNNMHSQSGYESGNLTHQNQQVKKYMEISKSYPYYMMNHSIPPPMNNSMPSSMNSSIHSQMNIPMYHQMNSANSYMGNNQINSSYNPMRNVPKNLQNGYSYGINPYVPHSYIPSMIPPQYMGNYSGNMLGSFNQFSQQQPYPQGYNFQKLQRQLKNTQANNTPANETFDKKIQNQRLNNYRNEKIMDKSKGDQVPKSIKNSNPGPVTKISHNYSSNCSTKTQQIKNKGDFNDFLPKKLPFKETKKLSEPNQAYKVCACRGFYEYESSFVCAGCKNKFHYQCLSMPITNQQLNAQDLFCAHCKMRSMDPLNKVEKAIGEFYLMNLTQKNFQRTINFKPYQTLCKEKNSKYQIEVRCIRSGEHLKNLEITWPDQCMFKINGQKMIEIPALQSNSSLKKRKDYSVLITQNLYGKIPPAIDLANCLDNIKFSLQLKNLTPEQISNKKIRNQYTFSLGVYLVQKLNADELYAKIMDGDHITDINFLKKLMDSSENQVQIDKITVRLLDPFSWDIIKTPVRGYKCNHAQCFDLKTFISLMFSAKNRTWKCPLCSKDARRFILDEQYQSILKKAQQLNPVPKEAMIYKNGQVAFKVEKDSDDEDEKTDKVTPILKTKKIMKQKKQQVSK